MAFVPVVFEDRLLLFMFEFVTFEDVDEDDDNEDDDDDEVVGVTVATLLLFINVLLVLFSLSPGTAQVGMTELASLPLEMSSSISVNSPSRSHLHKLSTSIREFAFISKSRNALKSFFVNPCSTVSK